MENETECTEYTKKKREWTTLHLIFLKNLDLTNSDIQMYLMLQNFSTFICQK